MLNGPVSLSKWQSECTGQQFPWQELYALYSSWSCVALLPRSFYSQSLCISRASNLSAHGIVFSVGVRMYSGTLPIREQTIYLTREEQRHRSRPEVCPEYMSSTEARLKQLNCFLAQASGCLRVKVKF